MRSEVAVSGRRTKPVVISPIAYENLRGASNSNPTSYVEGVAYVFTAPGGIDGYTFAGWSPKSITTDLTGALTVTASWTANRYQIKYDANGGAGKMASTECVYDENANVATNGFVKSGCEFAGWAIEPEGEVVYEEGAEVTNLTVNQNGVVVLYAAWAKSYKVRFESGIGDGEAVEEEYDYGKVYKLPEGLFDGGGRRFVDWRAASTGKRYDPGVLVFNLTSKGNPAVMIAVWETE